MMPTPIDLVGTRVRNLAYASSRYLLDGQWIKVPTGATGVITAWLPDDDGPCEGGGWPCPDDDDGHDEGCACSGTGVIPPDPTWVVQWETDVPGVTYGRLIRPEGRGIDWESEHYGWVCPSDASRRGGAVVS